MIIVLLVGSNGGRPQEGREAGAGWVVARGRGPAPEDPGQVGDEADTKGDGDGQDEQKVTEVD